jgi:hypothetical protein
MDRATVRSSPGGDHRSLKAIVRSRENEKKVLELCLRGATGAQAADAVGLSESGVSRALHRALKRISQPEAEQVRHRMMEELQRLRFEAWQLMSTDRNQGIQRALQVQEREARLLGLDAPAKREISGPAGGTIRLAADDAITPEYARQIQEAVKQIEDAKVIEVADAPEASAEEYAQ